MAFRLIVQSALERHRKPSDSLIAKMTFTLKVAGATVAPVAPPENATARFDVTNDGAGTDVELSVQIPPLAGMKKPILAATQKFKIVRSTGTGASGAPSPMLVGVAGPKGPLHPRFRPPRAVGAGKTMQIHVEIDTTWLDLTEYAATVSKEHAAVAAFLHASSSRLIVVEHSGGGPGRMPTTWFLLVPPAVSQSAAALNLFLFFRPEIIPTPTDPAYVNTDDAPFEGRFERYILSEAHPGRYVLASQFDAFASAGFNSQLVASGKPVVLAFPMPHVTSWGRLTTRELTVPAASPTGETILAHLLRALWGDDSLAASASAAPTVKRLALGGFSLGGDVCLQSWAANANQVDELYLFDPGQGIPNTVTPWFQAKPTDRRLRMLGCAYSETHSLQIAAAIEKFFDDPSHKATRPSHHWTAKPGDPAFWYGPQYRKALSNPVTPQDLEFIDDAKASASSGATKASNVFMTSFHLDPPGTATANSSITLTAKWPGQTTAAPALKVSLISNAEVASYLRYRIIPRFNGGSPVTSVEQWTKIHGHIQNNDFNGEQPRSKCVRHEWAVIGGEERQGAFVGHLQLCLEGSGFV